MLRGIEFAGLAMNKSIQHSIDWFQYSVAWPTAIERWPMEHSHQMALIRTAVPMVGDGIETPQRPDDAKISFMQGYSKSYDLAYCTAHVNPNRPDMRIAVRFTGDELRAYRALGGTDSRLIDFARNVGGKQSRIDIALDFRGYGIDPMKVYADWKAGRVNCRARKVRPFTEGTKQPDGSITEASTLYFGSRTSETMIRLYEKGKQENTSEDWVRMEAEIKGQAAQNAVDDCYRLGVALVARQVCRDYFASMPYRFWRDVLNGEIAQLTPAKRKQTTREAWLFDVIFPLIREEIRGEWDSMEERGIIACVESLVREHWQERARAHMEQYGLTK